MVVSEDVVVGLVGPVACEIVKKACTCPALISEKVVALLIGALLSVALPSEKIVWLIASAAHKGIIYIAYL